MNRATRLEITDNAQAHIIAASTWWSAHRPAAPDAIVDELDRIFDLLLSEPAMGTPAKNAELADVRRITVSRIRYFVYYRHVNDAIQILAVWHTSRGQSPDL